MLRILMILMLGARPSGLVLRSATTQCHDWYDHGGYLKRLTTNVVASYFDITTNADDGEIFLMDCQAGHESRPVGGRAQWGGTKTITCATGQTAVDLTTLDKIKGLYR